jgi:hypothetical protein
MIIKDKLKVDFFSLPFLQQNRNNGRKWRRKETMKGLVIEMQ